MSIRILVVEDDLIQRGVLASLLEQQGYYVEIAENGLDALKKARIGWFDLVLMDYALPEVDGLAAARLIADLTKASGRPRLIALSASAEHLQAREVGAKSVFDAVIQKPWNPQSVLATIERCHAAAPNSGYRWASGNDVLINRSGGRHRVTEQWMATAEPDPAPVPRDQTRDPVVNVLIVDDDDLLQSFFKSALEADGYGVDTATNGLDALRKIALFHYEIVILDYQMPEIDGLATARLIFELVGKSDRPQLIALTSAPERVSERENGSLSVFDHIIPKSHGMGAVLAAVKQSADYRKRRAERGSVDIRQLASGLYP